MRNAPVASWANSCLFSSQILIENKWKLVRELRGRIPLHFFMETFPELSGPIPLRFFDESVSKVNGKYSWSFLGKAGLLAGWLASVLEKPKKHSETH